MVSWWQTKARLEQLEPFAVDVTRRDGGRGSLYFPSRAGAELYLARLPEMQVSGDLEAADIVEAVMRPVGVGVN